MCLCLLLSGCGFILLPEFEVKGVVYDSQKIAVKFSGEADKLSVAKSVSFLEDEESLATTFEFLGDTVFIYPKNGIRPNYDYTLVIANEAEDTNGCSLGKNFVYSFSTRSEKDKPYVVSISPENNSNVITDMSEIVINFSESVRRDSFEKSFSVTPSFDCAFLWTDSDKTVVVKAKTSLPVNTEFVIKIRSELEDLSQNTMAEDFSSVIYYKIDSSEPDFSVTLKSDGWQKEVSEDTATEEVPLDADVLISFDKPVKISSAASYISITPSLSYSVEKDDVNGTYLNLDLQDARWNQKYVLRIESGISDLSGNIVKDDREYTLVFNNEKNRPVSFIEGYFQTAQWASSSHSDDEYKLLNDSANYSNLTMKATDFPANTEKDCSMFLVFACSKESDGIDLFSAMDCLSVAQTNSCCSIDLRRMKILSPDEYESEKISGLFTDAVDFSSHKISVLKVDFQFRNSAKEGLVTITISGEIKDSLKNSMQKDKVFVLSK